MSLPPPNKLAASLHVLQLAILRARALAWSGEREGLLPAQASELGALMDAVHNIPELIQRWETCDEELLRQMLDGFDDSHGGGLVAAYDRVARGASPP